MKYLSINRTLVDAGQSFRRFPLVLLSAAVATGSSLYQIETSFDGGTVVRILQAAVFGIPFLLALSLAIEKQVVQKRLRLLLQVFGTLVPVFYFLFIPEDIPYSHSIRFVVLLVGMHLLISVAPFFRGNPGQALWQFNKVLIFRLISSLLFTLVMYAGLSLALAALDNLLGIPLSSEIYVDLFVILGFIFNTWFFLGGIPQDPLALAADDDFPRPLRVFSQHILSTLVVVYLAIMMAYLGKVVLSGVWPSGWIGWLVSGVAVAGLLSVVLLSPLQGRDGNRWVGIYFRIFHILMLPAVAMLVLAVSKRVNQYGLTELRYILLILSGWLVVILLLGLFSKRIAIRVIPLSLGLVALLLSFGPWGVVAVSRNSQVGRLETELSAAGLFADGHLVPAQTDTISIQEKEIRKSFNYLIEQFGFAEVEKWLTPEMQKSVSQNMDKNKPKYRNHWAKADLIINELNLPDAPVLLTRKFNKHTMLGAGRFNAISVDGMKYSLVLSMKPGNSVGFIWNEVHCGVALDESGGTLILKRHGQVILEMPLVEILLDLSNSGNPESERHVVAPEEMTFDYSNENLSLRLIIHEVLFQDDSELPLVKKLEGLLFLGAVVDDLDAAEQ